MTIRLRYQPLITAFALAVSVALAPTAGAAPVTLTWSPPLAIDSGHALTSVKCRSNTQCTAVDDAGNTVTFNPVAHTASAPVALDSRGLNGVACPATNQCTAVDGSGYEVTFNPVSPTAATSRPVASSSLNNVVCPLPTQCTAVGSSGQEVTFDPSPGGLASAYTLSPGHSLTFLTCPGSTDCTAVDNAGNAFTFDPASPAGGPSFHVDSAGLNGVSCPSSLECVTVDGLGNLVLFNPNVGPQAPGPIDNAALNSIGCPSTTFCLAVDNAGNALVGDPTTGGRWAITPIGMGPLTALACGSNNVCVVVGTSGSASVGTTPPVEIAPPTVSGTATEGHTLTEAHGTWSNFPLYYSYEWERCDSGGASCLVLGGTNGQTYTLTSADVGHTMRVAEFASNAGAYAGPAISAQTAAVAPGPPPPLLGLDIAGTVRSGSAERVSVYCQGAAGQICSGLLALTARELVVHRRVVGVSTHGRRGATSTFVIVGAAPYRVGVGSAAMIVISANRTGRNLLDRFFRFPVTLVGALAAQNLTFGFTFPSTLLDYYTLPAPGGSVITQLTLKRLPPHAQLVVSCSGGGCPFHRVTRRPRHPTVMLASLFGRRDLSFGASFGVEVTAVNYVGILYEFTVRPSAPLSEVTLCQAPGARRPGPCT